MSNFKVLLVYPNLQMVNLLPSNIASLSAYLKANGVEVKLFDTTLYRTAQKSVDEIRVEHLQVRPFNLSEKGVNYKTSDVFEDFVNLVSEFAPDIIAVSVTDDTYNLGVSLVSKIKDRKSHVIFGGVYPTFSPEKVISNELIDSICIGEGEAALLELSLCLEAGKDISHIKNLWVKKSGKVVKNGLGPLLDINTLPHEDFTIFERERFFRPMQGKVYRMLPVCIDRGCPFSCSFCAAPLKRRLYSDAGAGQYFRVKSIPRVIEELEFQVEKYKIDYIYFNSETFFARKNDDISKFAKEYSAKIRLPFWCQTHVETISEDKIRLLKEMNCDRISIGIEHGNEEFRKKRLNKFFTNKQVISAFKILDKYEIPVTVNNIIGFPEETRELAFDTIRLNRSITADSINAFFFVPYSGTPLRQYCIDRGFMSPDAQTNSLMRSTILNMPQFTAEEIGGLVRTFSLYVKMPETYFSKIKLAEKENEEGNAAFNELSQIFFKEYFKTKKHDKKVAIA
ncbi:MAG: radical SAM protein [Candidatus Omnitrophica bacterium]|nr:radical SAM protein [Candidatus Omnitrophota bacterium]